MLRSLKLGVVLAVLCLQGCSIRSLLPFYKEGATVTVPAANGAWQSVRWFGDKVKPDDRSVWTFAGETILTQDTDGAKASLEIVYFKVGDVLYADVAAGKPDANARINGNWLFHHVPVHTLWRMRVTADALVAEPVDHQWLLDHRDAWKAELKVVEVEKDQFVFTSSPEEWQAFLQKHAADKELFAAKYACEFARVRKSEPVATPAPAPSATPPTPGK